MRDVERTGEIHLGIREAARVAHTRGTYALRGQRRVVHAGEVVAFIVGGGIVDAGREVLVGVGLGILTMAPDNLEVLRHRVVGHVFLALLGHHVVEVHIAGILVALAVV